jgi:hypothetical protein
MTKLLLRAGVLALVRGAMSEARIPGGSLLGVPVERLMRRRRQAAGELLLVELRRGGRTFAEVEEDELAAVVYRYSRAAQEGTARLNLRLMATVIAGQAFRGNLATTPLLARLQAFAPIEMALVEEAEARSSN